MVCPRKTKVKQGKPMYAENKTMNNPNNVNMNNIRDISIGYLSALHELNIGRGTIREAGNVVNTFKSRILEFMKAKGMRSIQAEVPNPNGTVRPVWIVAVPKPNRKPESEWKPQFYAEMLDKLSKNGGSISPIDICRWEEEYKKSDFLTNRKIELEEQYTCPINNDFAYLVAWVEGRHNDQIN